MAYALVVVTLRMLEVDAGIGNHYKVFWHGIDREVVYSNRSIMWFCIVLSRIHTLWNEVLFLRGTDGIYILP